MAKTKKGHGNGVSSFGGLVLHKNSIF